MGKRRIRWTRKTIAKRISQGFGKGSGASYKPWLVVQTFPSWGRVHRILGMKTNRVHHLFSDLEANVFHTYDFLPSIVDIREQFPLLPTEETIAIATECGIAHPMDPRTREPIVMTTDQFLTLNRADGFAYWARAIKYDSDLCKARTNEKLEIERRYWKARGIDWGIVRECEIDREFVANVKWLRPYYRVKDLYPLTPNDIALIAGALTNQVLIGNLSLREIADQCDDALHLRVGSALVVARHMIANKWWIVDMRKRIQPGEHIRLIAIDQKFFREGL